ncbi:hypothetical protein ERO13_D12G074203v2 [Gossypium hirsutum]|nr:hypothetical protein ES319_D12G092900v1 [Gossypium barbadense]KAG4115111.1 hypothetical protein ERO13_D12G074203v2 [Gossypium hirsutum]TYG40508.1 hypothetical protein ES288_D12G098400v1 [Gossypium darwinii]
MRNLSSLKTLSLSGNQLGGKLLHIQDCSLDIQSSGDVNLTSRTETEPPKSRAKSLT